MEKHTIEARIQASIKPQLDRADDLLDYYTECLPREVWRAIARDLGAAPDAFEPVVAWQDPAPLTLASRYASTA